MEWIMDWKIVQFIPKLREMKERRRQEFDVILNFIEMQIKNHEDDFDLNQPRDFIDLCLQKSLEAESLNQKLSVGPENIKKIIRKLILLSG
jgi:hypothetical protein